jgi:DNA-binding transcriptional MerR regulator
MGVSKTTIWRWTNSGKIPAGTIVKFRSCRYYRADKIQALGVIRPGSRRPHTGGYTKGSKRPVPDGVWSVKQVAAFMAVGPVSILRWANWGVIPSSAIVEYHGCKYYRESGIRELGVILSPGKVAKRYGVGRNTINRWRTTGLLRGIETPGNVFLYLEKELSAETRKD